MVAHRTDLRPSVARPMARLTDPRPSVDSRPSADHHSARPASAAAAPHLSTVPLPLPQPPHMECLPVPRPNTEHHLTVDPPRPSLDRLHSVALPSVDPLSGEAVSEAAAALTLAHRPRTAPLLLRPARTVLLLRAAHLTVEDHSEDRLRPLVVAREDTRPVGARVETEDGLREVARVEMEAGHQVAARVETEAGRPVVAREDSEDLDQDLHSVDRRSAAAPPRPAMERRQCHRRCPRSTRPTVDTHKALLTSQDNAIERATCSSRVNIHFVTPTTTLYLLMLTTIAQAMGPITDGGQWSSLNRR